MVGTFFSQPEAVKINPSGQKSESVPENGDTIDIVVSTGVLSAIEENFFRDGSLVLSYQQKGEPLSPEDPPVYWEITKTNADKGYVKYTIQDSLEEHYSYRNHSLKFGDGKGNEKHLFHPVSWQIDPFYRNLPKSLPLDKEPAIQAMWAVLNSKIAPLSEQEIQELFPKRKQEIIDAAAKVEEFLIEAEALLATFSPNNLSARHAKVPRGPSLVQVIAENPTVKCIYSFPMGKPSIRKISRKEYAKLKHSLKHTPFLTNAMTSLNPAVSYIL